MNVCSLFSSHLEMLLWWVERITKPSRNRRVEGLALTSSVTSGRSSPFWTLGWAFHSSPRRQDDNAHLARHVRHPCLICISVSEVWGSVCLSPSFCLTTEPLPLRPPSIQAQSPGVLPYLPLCYSGMSIFLMLPFPRGRGDGLTLSQGAQWTSLTLAPSPP